MRFLVLLLLSMSMSSSLFHGTDSKEPPELPGGDVGGFQPIKNLTDPHILDIAKFAVSEYNKESGSHLIFQKIVSGMYQVVAGTNYLLIIEAMDGTELSNYEAKVFEDLKMNLTLNSFKKLLEKKAPRPVSAIWKPVENLEKDMHILEIARNAVLEHNKELMTNANNSHDHHDHHVIVFEKVVSAETLQEVLDHHDGVKYRLVISANGAKYEALVWEKVTSFKPIP
ncbi:hypothetical protein J5N97_015589 [Dioscorea zingiberensis]|uniref:Cystatin domain-containing protein n=1 Tax=Dioscorea zingiberensis TaxID=325984 RepID=A0A9D5HEG3_9LILI|nr:hypothetical protein J5N97_015589 [Dioscorea zingiberensis]